MSGVPVADSYADDFVQEFFQPVDSSDSASVARSIKKQTNVLENFEIEPQTRWGLLNAFTGYIDYDARSKGGAGGRLSSIWFGSGAQRKTAAYKYLAHDVADIAQ